MVRLSTSKTPVAPIRPSERIARRVSGGIGSRLATRVQVGPTRLPGAEHPSADGLELERVAEEVDEQAGLVAEPLAGDDRLLPDPEADDDRLDLPAVDAEGPAGPRRPARLVVLEPEALRLRAADAPFDDLGVAEVVPAVGDAVAVGVDLEVFERLGPSGTSVAWPSAGPWAGGWRGGARAESQGIPASRDPRPTLCVGMPSWTLCVPRPILDRADRGRRERQDGIPTRSVGTSGGDRRVRLSDELTAWSPSAASFWASAGHGDEQGRPEHLVDELAVLLDHQVDPLVELAAQGDDHPAPFLELLDERGGDLGRGAGDDDRVERRGLGPARVAVADPGVDVRVAEFLVDLGGPLAQRRVDLDRVDVLDEPREDRRLIARAGADLVDLVGRLGLEDLGHEGHVVRRGDGLPFADVDRLVVVGQALGVGREELGGGGRSGRRRAPACP